jgi:hypothetical protein
MALAEVSSTRSTSRSLMAARATVWFAPIWEVGRRPKPPKSDRR